MACWTQIFDRQRSYSSDHSTMTLSKTRGNGGQATSSHPHCRASRPGGRQPAFLQTLEEAEDMSPLHTSLISPKKSGLAISNFRTWRSGACRNLHLPSNSCCPLERVMSSEGSGYSDLPATRTANAGKPAQGHACSVAHSGTICPSQLFIIT